MNSTGKLAVAAAAVVVGGFLYYRNKFAIPNPATGMDANPTGSASLAGNSSLSSVLGAGSSLMGSGVGMDSGGSTGTTARTTATTGAAATSVTPGAASVEAAASSAAPASIQPSWVSPIEAAWRSGGVEAVRALETSSGVGPINAGQARAIWGLSDADVGYLQQQGVLSGNILAA